MSDTARVLITEVLEKVSVNRVATFTIEANPSLGTPVIEVLSPTRESIPVQIKQTGHGSYNAGFTPKDVGAYLNIERSKQIVYDFNYCLKSIMNVFFRK